MQNNIELYLKIIATLKTLIVPIAIFFGVLVVSHLVILTATKSASTASLFSFALIVVGGLLLTVKVAAHLNPPPSLHGDKKMTAQVAAKPSIGMKKVPSKPSQKKESQKTSPKAMKKKVAQKEKKPSAPMEKKRIKKPQKVVPKKVAKPLPQKKKIKRPRMTQEEMDKKVQESIKKLLKKSKPLFKLLLVLLGIALFILVLIGINILSKKLLFTFFTKKGRTQVWDKLKKSWKPIATFKEEEAKNKKATAEIESKKVSGGNGADGIYVESPEIKSKFEIRGLFALVDEGESNEVQKKFKWGFFLSLLAIIVVVTTIGGLFYLNYKKIKEKIKEIQNKRKNPLQKEGRYDSYEEKIIEKNKKVKNQVKKEESLPENIGKEKGKEAFIDKKDEKGSQKKNLLKSFFKKKPEKEKVPALQESGNEKEEITPQEEMQPLGGDQEEGDQNRPTAAEEKNSPNSVPYPEQRERFQKVQVQKQQIKAAPSQREGRMPQEGDVGFFYYVRMGGIVVSGALKHALGKRKEARKMTKKYLEKNEEYSEEEYERLYESEEEDDDPEEDDEYMYVEGSDIPMIKPDPMKKS